MWDEPGHRDEAARSAQQLGWGRGLLKTLRGYTHKVAVEWTRKTGNTGTVAEFIYRYVPNCGRGVGLRIDWTREARTVRLMGGAGCQGCNSKMSRCKQESQFS